jgi:DNA polymerase-3 subunit epsilon
MTTDAILYLDTETTGMLAKNHPAGSPAHPHICQLGAQLVCAGRIVGEMNLLVKPNRWAIPAEAQAVHGISTEMCEKFGLPAKSVIMLAARLIQRSSLVVCHNFTFDQMMVWTEMIRAETAAELAEFLAKPHFCTMEGSTPILNLPPTQRMVAAGYNKPKNPNLGEAYRFFTGREFVGAHDAMEDTRGCRLIHEGILAWQAKNATAPQPTCLDE